MLPITQSITNCAHISNANTTIGRGVWGSTQVVIKKMNPTITMTAAQYEHLIDELCVLNKIDSFVGEQHNCLPCLSVFMINGRINLVFPLCICDFRIFYYQDWHFCDTVAPIIIKFIMEIVNALQFLHAHGISHRDIKADNVLICYKNGKFSAKVTDYGSSTFEAETTRSDGTRQYMAPEVFSIIKNGEGFKELACGLVQDDTAIEHALFLQFVLSLPSDKVIGRHQLL